MSTNKTTKKSSKRSTKKTSKRQARNTKPKFTTTPSLFDTEIHKDGITHENGAVVYKSIHPAVLLLIMALVALVLILTLVIIKRGDISIGSRRPIDQKEASLVKGKDKEQIKEVLDEQEKPENQEITEKTEEKAIQITRKLYFLYYDEKTDLLGYKSVKRSLNGEDYITALQALFDGPLKKESAAGLETSLSPAMNIHSLIVQKGIAVIDLNAAFMDNSYGDIAYARINQLFFTLKQFPEVKGIVIKVNGKVLKTTEDGHTLVWPMTKKL